MIALCKCGIDMSEHDLVRHIFEAAGTKHQCTKPIYGYLCARPKYHEDEGMPCGPLTGDKLW